MFTNFNIVDEIVIDGVEILNDDDSNDLDMDNEVTIKNKKSMPVSWKRNVNKKLRMKGEAYLGYSRSKQKIVSHNIERVCKSIRPACSSEVCKKSKKKKMQ